MYASRPKLNVDKTELLWAGSRCGSAMLRSTGLFLQLGTKTVAESDVTSPCFQSDTDIAPESWHSVDILPTCQVADISTADHKLSRCILNCENNTRCSSLGNALNIYRETAI